MNIKELFYKPLDRAINGVVKADQDDNATVYQELDEYVVTNEQDIVLMTGVGSVWPLLRAHHLLNSLHSLLGHKPVVLFYPGYYDGQAMSLFGKIPSNNYYRAFRLVP